MDELNRPSETFHKLKNCLKPFLVTREKALRVRRILRLYLTSHLQSTNYQSINRPLLFPDTSCSVEGSLQGVKGHQREYLRCIHLNISARNEYNLLSKEKRVNRDDETSEISISHFSNKDDTISSTDTFIDLFEKKQRHERLQIIQNYIESLNLKPAASIDYIDPINALRRLETLQKVPQEVMQPLGFGSETMNLNLGNLRLRLEKTVFQARALLKREQKLLLNIKTKSTTSPNTPEFRLFALGITRNELINWIESEFVKTDALPADSSDNNCDPKPQSEVSFDLKKSLDSIQKLYLKYLDTRKLLITCSKEDKEYIETQTLEPMKKNQTNESKDQVKIDSILYLIHPYLYELSLLAKRQKMMIQQKVNLMTNLTKQLEEANLGFDRLSHESHLLPLYSTPTVSVSNRKNCDTSIFLTEKTSMQEKSSSSHYAKSWALASQSSGQSTADTVFQKVEKGNMSISDAHSDIEELGHLLGIVTGDGVASKSHHLWTDLNKNFDIIKAQISDND